MEPGTANLHYRNDPASTFSFTPLTPLGGLDYQAVLPATNCTLSPEFYFSAQGSGGTPITNPRRDSVPPYYSAEVVSQSLVFFQQNLDANPQWTAQGLWEWGQPTGGGGLNAGSPDPISGYTNNFVYGYNLDGDYPNNMNETSLTTKAIDCTDQYGVRLTFRRWLGVEYPEWDHAYVRASNDEIHWTTVWQNDAEVADSAWVLQEVDLSAVADNQPTVYVRWTMGTSDGSVTYCGWNIDDIRLYSIQCDGLFGDFNGDDRVAQDDFNRLGVCFSGPGVNADGGCAIFDFDADADVDLRDFTVFQLLFTGP